jgi:hypothetical protein
VLYDPKQGEYPFVLSSLISWLEKQPADGTYRYEDSRRCLFCQYLTSLGYRNVVVNPVTWRHGVGPFVVRSFLPREWESIARAGTFGGALYHARRLARA